MKQLALAFALSLAACGPAADRGPTLGNQPDPSTDRAATTACPSGDALAEAARAAWGKGAGTVTADCVVMNLSGETFWLFDGFFEPEPNDDYSIGMWTALVTPTGEVRWAEGGDDFPASTMDKSASSEHEAVDLDGDGNDELVYVEGYSWGGNDDRSVVVVRVTTAGLENLPGENLPLSSDNSAADVDPSELYSCEGEHRIVDAGDGRKLLEITYSGDCERVGPVVWAYDGKALVEVK
jgi:hypothetical protein